MVPRRLAEADTAGRDEQTEKRAGVLEEDRRRRWVARRPQLVLEPADAFAE